MTAASLRRYGIVVAAFSAFFTLFFAPVVFGGAYLTSGDGERLALPAYLVRHDWWEPNLLLGYPWAASLNAYWYPLGLLRWIPGSFNVFMLLAYIAAAVGTWGLVAAATASRVGATVAALAYALGGFMIGHLGHYDVVQPAAWAPFVFWSLVKLRRAPRRRWIVVGASALGLCATAGQPQVLAYTLLVAVAWIAVMRQSIRASSAVVVLGLGLGAIALVPGWELGRASVRASLPFDDFASFSVPPGQIPMRLLFPYALGNENWPELSGYVGITTLLLALVALGAARPRRDVAFWAGTALVGLVLATGNALGLGVVTYHLPVIDLFRAQGRHLFEVTLALAVLAGYGAAAIGERRAHPRTIGTAVLVVAAAFAAVLRLAVPAPLSDPAFELPLGMFVLTSIAVVAWSRSPQSRAAALLMLATVAIDLGSFAQLAYWRSAAVLPAQLAPPPYVAALRATLERDRQRVLSLSPQTVLPPNVPLLWDLPQADGYVSLLLQRPGEFLQLFPDGSTRPALLAAGDPSLDAAGVRFVALSPDAPAAAQLRADPARWRVVAGTAPDLVFENRRVYPRAWIVHDVRPVAPDAAFDALRALRAGSLDPRRSAFVEDAAGLHDAGEPGESVDIVADAPTRMTLAVRCAAACFVVTSDALYPGWHAALDGAAIAVVRADYALRGALVPSGQHVLTFSYFPLAQLLGAAITLAAALALLVLGLRSG